MEEPMGVHGCLLNDDGLVVDAGLCIAVPQDGLYVSHGAQSPVDDHKYRPTSGGTLRILRIPRLGVN